jgi:hypothetical protein
MRGPFRPSMDGDTPTPLPMDYGPRRFRCGGQAQPVVIRCLRLMKGIDYVRICFRGWPGNGRLQCHAGAVNSEQSLGSHRNRSSAPVASLTECVWLKADLPLHARHSKDSSDNSEAKIISFAESLGMDYLCITDHDDVAHNTWTDAEFKPNSALLLNGAEWTRRLARYHMNTKGELALKTAGLFEEFLRLIQAEAEAKSVLEENSSASE